MKKIIVGIDGSKDSFDAYKCAVSLFPGQDIALTSVFVRDERKMQIPFIYSGAAYDIAYERLYIPIDPQLEKTFEKLNADNKIFAEKCVKMCEKIETSKNVKKFGTILGGDPADELMKYSKNFNLLVLGQRGENAAYVRELIGSTSEDLIRKSLIPVLICPSNQIKLDRILIVYEDSQSSANAFEYYINELSMYNSELTILIKDNFEDSSSKIKDKIISLEDSGIKIIVEHCYGSLAHKALEIMESSSLDTFVLGSHGKHKLAEYLLGSVTVHIIRKSSLPLFVVH